jgi:hypothetical protein
MNKTENTTSEELDDKYGYEAVRLILAHLDSLKTLYSHHEGSGETQQFHEVIDYVYSLVEGIQYEGLEGWGLDMETLIEEELVEVK